MSPRKHKAQVTFKFFYFLKYLQFGLTYLPNVKSVVVKKKKKRSVPPNTFPLPALVIIDFSVT